MSKQPLPEKERISKFLSRAGVCSRRDGERYILEGRVKLNGVLLLSPVTLVGKDDQVEVDGYPVLEKPPTRVWVYYKPAGVVTTHKDPEGRPTVFANLPANMPRVMSVGRLDLNSEGLLLLTNDGEFARKAEHPKTGWKRTYRVRVHGEVDPQRIAALRHGIIIDGVHYKGIIAQLLRQTGKNAWIVMTLSEGKNREIRRIMEHLGYAVNRLIRISYGPFNIGTLLPGEILEMSM